VELVANASRNKTFRPIFDDIARCRCIASLPILHTQSWAVTQEVHGTFVVQVGIRFAAAVNFAKAI
jgi:hypothetical protein